MLDNDGTVGVANVVRSNTDRELEGCEMASSLEIVKSQSIKSSSPGTGTYHRQMTRDDCRAS